jgi:hypothetical protein
VWRLLETPRGQRLAAASVSPRERSRKYEERRKKTAIIAQLLPKVDTHGGGAILLSSFIKKAAAEPNNTSGFFASGGIPDAMPCDVMRCQLHFKEIFFSANNFR